MTRSKYHLSNFVLAVTLLIVALTFNGSAIGSEPIVCGAFAPDANVKAATDRTTVHVADPFSLTVSATVPDNSKVQFPSPTQRLGDFNIVSVKDQFDIPTQAGRLWMRVYELESLASGELSVPAIGIIVNGKELRSTPIRIQVQSVLEEQADPFVFRDIKDTVEIPEVARSSKTWIARLIVGGIGLGSVAILLIVARRKSIARPEAWAYHQLDDLKQSEAFSTGDQRKLLPQVADVLREYIRRRFNIAAPQLTTTEFLELAKSDHRLNANQQMQLKFLLHQVDQIKFASFLPGGNQLETTFEQAHQFIEDTTAQFSNGDFDSPSNSAAVETDHNVQQENA